MILVAPMIPAPGDTPGTWWSSTGQDAASREAAIAEGRDPDAPFDVRETFLHDVPEPVVEDLFARGERPESGRAFEDTWPLAAWPDLPTRVIAGRRDRLFPLPFMQRVVARPPRRRARDRRQRPSPGAERPGAARWTTQGLVMP